MRLTVRPGARLEGRVRVPGDKSIAHRWLILAATGEGPSRLRDLPPSLDVRSTAACLAALLPNVRPSLDAWSSNVARGGERNGFTWDASASVASTFELQLDGEGREALRPADGPMDCGNSGTSMRLLAGLLAAAPFASTLVGDPSLMRRPMERLAEPLRAMGAAVGTREGRPPLEVRGGRLRGISYRSPVPSAQLKGAVLLAGCAATGRTEITEPAPSRDHTERALEALGAPIQREARTVSVSAFRNGGVNGSVPGDVSSAAFLIGAAAITGGRVEIADVGLNPSRTRFLDVFRRMGVEIETVERAVELGEPAGDLVATGPAALAASAVGPDELPLVIDEVPVLAAVAAHAGGDSRFSGAAELRGKESDRLNGLAAGLRAIGAPAAVDGDDLVVAGGGVRGGSTEADGDHRMAMAMAIAGLRASAAVVVDGAEVSDVSFPGFAAALRTLGADVEVVP